MDPTQNNVFGNQPSMGTGGFGSSMSSGVPMNSGAPMSPGTGDIVLNNGGGKSKKWWWIVGVIGGVVLLFISFFLLRQSGVIDSFMRDDRMSNEELVKKLEQVNYDLSVLSNEYNSMLSGKMDSIDTGVLFKSRDFTERDLRYDELKNEINELPLSEKTMINSDDKEGYTEYLDEIKIRFNTMEENKELLKKFQTAFFTPISNYANEDSEDDDSSESVERDELINASDDAVKKVAKEFDGLYQVIKQRGLDKEAIDVYLIEHNDLRNNFVKCFKKIEDPDAFYEKINEFINGIRGRYDIS